MFSLPSILLQQKSLEFHQFSSVQSSHSVVSDSLRPHEPQHARPPCPSPTPESTKTHVHRVGDSIQPSHPLSSPSPPALNLSQHKGLFKWVSSSHPVAKVLEFQLQHQCIVSHVIIAWSATWIVHDLSRDQCMISQGIRQEVGKSLNNWVDLLKMGRLGEYSGSKSSVSHGTF